MYNQPIMQQLVTNIMPCFIDKSMNIFLFLITVEKDMSELVSLAVTGMKCGGCETNVKTKLNSVDGVISIEAMSKENKVDVEFDAEKTSIEAISQAITEAGFVVE